MQLLYLLIILGATQGDKLSGSNQLISPDCYNNLGVPNAFQYVSLYVLSVQSSYITSVECMRSSNYYIKSGFSEIDSVSNDLESNLIMQYNEQSGSIENMMLNLQQNDVEKESQDKLNAVLYMTANYYQKKDVTVKKSEAKLSEVTEVLQAQSTLTAKRCESSYTEFMNDATTIKSKYTSKTSSTDNTNSNQWDTQVKEYNEARENVVSNTNIYASVRDAFLFGRGINLCDGQANIDQSLLDIYKTNDLSKFFAKNDNDAMSLLNQTVTQMYTIYKASLTNIYLKSVVHSNSSLAVRVMMWEQVNIVRAHFELKAQNIVLFIKKTQSDAKSSYDVNSNEYKKIMEQLYSCVNKRLLTNVKSTEVHYTRALNFNPDKCAMEKDFNPYKVDTIEKYNENILKNNTNAAKYDIRTIKKEEFSYPTSQVCIPQKMYALELNKLVSQTFICQVNDIYARMKTTKYDNKSVDSWIYEKISLVQFQNSIRFSKCSAIANKIFTINSATYTFTLLKTDQNIPSTNIEKIIDQTTNDVVGTLCVNTLEITDTSETVEIFVKTNFNSGTISENKTEIKSEIKYDSGIKYPATSNKIEYKLNNYTLSSNKSNPGEKSGNPAPAVKMSCDCSKS
ncbi:PREDICTED: uncharacterized protein LOC107163297 isoform X2 [Diuraphis noxia]|uniref:uncharacterized protein LOC107163297 isoform X1 n=1 Tax=Diuraphis noxia TaxID=143948 RepID=UPI000763580C|nr:PREDICTED: uncharacterized protein LOC107163297 isoform X1 [Diuraphis noxia]XP_015366134.1 PREDICTED: uncharacterized protein LOC107163297 isoform X2 [Diuraphis noxia]